MRLRPSEILYSQDSIGNTFNNRCLHRTKKIGETLDDICEGRCNVTAIPPISVVNRYGKWTTTDNKRLWIFRQLETLGKCETITVLSSRGIPPFKLTSTNRGTDIRVRGGGPGGTWFSAVKTTANSAGREKYPFKENIPNPVVNVHTRKETGFYFNSNIKLFSQEKEDEEYCHCHSHNKDVESCLNSSYSSVYNTAQRENTTDPLGKSYSSTYKAVQNDAATIRLDRPCIRTYNTAHIVDTMSRNDRHYNNTTYSSAESEDVKRSPDGPSSSTYKTTQSVDTMSRLYMPYGNPYEMSENVDRASRIDRPNSSTCYTAQNEIEKNCLDEHCSSTCKTTEKVKITLLPQQQVSYYKPPHPLLGTHL